VPIGDEARRTAVTIGKLSQLLQLALIANIVNPVGFDPERHFATADLRTAKRSFALEVGCEARLTFT
jgi:hypothetical protein